MTDPTQPDPSPHDVAGGPAGGYGPPPPGSPPGTPPADYAAIPASAANPGSPALYPGMTPLGWVSTPWGPRWRGPIGQPKPKGTTVLLSIITCGIWTYLWSFQTHEDLKRYRGDGLGGAMGLVLALLVWPAVMFTVPDEIQKMYQEEGLPSPVQTTIGLWFLLPIIGNFIWYFKVQDALNDFWVARGATPA